MRIRCVSLSDMDTEPYMKYQGKGVIRNFPKLKTYLFLNFVLEPTHERYF